MKRYFGTKEFYRSVLTIAFPIVGQQFITTFVSLIDNIMIGSVGNIALTSVTVANQIYLIFNSTLFGICGAAGIYIAQYYGAKQNKKCQETLNINFMASILVAILFLIVLTFIPHVLIHFFTNTKDIVESSLGYITYVKYSYFPYAISFTVMMALRSMAVNKIQIKIGMVAVGINTCLNYCLIFGHFGFPTLGIQGAAIATLVARLVEMSIYLAVLFSKKYYFVLDIWGILHINKELCYKMIRKAIPLILNEILFSVGLTLIFKSYLRCDEYLTSAISVVDTVSQILFIGSSGLSSAVSILIGNKLGANLLDEARENARKLLMLAFMMSIGMGCICFIAASFIPNFYNVASDIKNVIMILLRIKAVSIIFHTVCHCVFFILRAGGDVVSTLLMDSGSLWILGVLVSTIFSMFTQVNLITLFSIVEGMNLIKLGVSFYFFKKENWVYNITV